MKCVLFLLDYINTPDTVKHLVLFGDVPSSQNKIHTVVRNLCDNKRFSTITHEFPVRSQSFSAFDRDFDTEKRLLRHIDHLYTPDEYTELILRASTNKRVVVYQVKTEDVLRFKNWWTQSHMKSSSLIKHLGKKRSVR